LAIRPHPSRPNLIIQVSPLLAPRPAAKAAYDRKIPQSNNVYIHKRPCRSSLVGARGVAAFRPILVRSSDVDRPRVEQCRRRTSLGNLIARAQNLLARPRTIGDGGSWGFA